MLGIVETIERKGAALRVLSLNLHTATATGRLMLTMLGAIAEFERKLMLEGSVRASKAKAAGRYSAPRSIGS